MILVSNSHFLFLGPLTCACPTRYAMWHTDWAMMRMWIGEAHMLLEPASSLSIFSLFLISPKTPTPTLPTSSLLVAPMSPCHAHPWITPSSVLASLCHACWFMPCSPEQKWGRWGGVNSMVTSSPLVRWNISSASSNFLLHLSPQALLPHMSVVSDAPAHCLHLCAQCSMSTAWASIIHLPLPHLAHGSKDFH